MKYFEIMHQICVVGERHFPFCLLFTAVILFLFLFLKNLSYFTLPPFSQFGSKGTLQKVKGSMACILKPVKPQGFQESKTALAARLKVVPVKLKEAFEISHI